MVGPLLPRPGRRGSRFRSSRPTHRRTRGLHMTRRRCPPPFQRPASRRGRDATVIRPHRTETPSIPQLSQRTCTSEPPRQGTTSRRRSVPTASVPAGVAPSCVAGCTILALAAHGLSNAEIATCRGLTQSQVKTHVSRILRMLRLNNRVRAAILAYSAGLSQPLVTQTPAPGHTLRRALPEISCPAGSRPPGTGRSLR